MPDIVVVAHNEAPRIGSVLDAITAADVGRLIVVCDSCTDGTEQVAARYSDQILPVQLGNKGSAMATGLAWVDTDAVLFLDADLVGLQPGHVQALAMLPPNDGMLVGITTGWFGETVARILGRLPSVSGQRRVPTGFARSIPLAGSGWEAETLINVAAVKQGLLHRQVVLRGVRNPTTVVQSPLGWLGKIGHMAEVSVRYGPELVRYVAS